MAASMDACYISASCNRVPHCLDWASNNTICYGSSNSIVIYEPQVSNDAGTIIQTAAIHKDRVNCVRFVRNCVNENGTELISCSSDKTAIHWKLEEKTRKLLLLCKLLGHTGAINVVEGICSTDEESEIWSNFDRLFATSSSDSTIKIWGKLKNGEAINCIQNISLESCFVLDLKFGLHPETSVPLLILGGTSAKVDIYVRGRTEFEKVISLPGHEDWIRAIDITLENEKNLLIASASQDCLIRVWRLSSDKRDESNSKDELKLRDNTYTVENSDSTTTSFIIRLDAIMAGHENWIYGLHWCPQTNIVCSLRQPLKLLSASMDKTMIIWECDQNLGVWLEKVRVGEVGGNTLGFYGGRFSPDGQFIVAHGYQGAFHLWHCETESGQWKPSVTVSGHFREVRDIDWDPEGEFLVSVSADQTTRLHAPWQKKDGSKQPFWYELARPQIHGYDLTCIAMLGRLKFASGADEKVLRAFEAPKNFVENFGRLCNSNIKGLMTRDKRAPEGASVPALGLSNKAVFEKSPPQDNEPKHPKDIYPESYFVSTELNEPPTEELLLQNTLWPEVHKLYGHGYEVFCIASNKDGTILASACKASKREHASVFLWNTTTWTNIAQLAGHSLTVTQIAFSPCGKHLLSVSRDRTWTLYSVRETDQSWYREAYSDKSNGIHSRIIWTCAWSHYSECFATGSRDKKVIVWKKQSVVDEESSLGHWTATMPALNLEDSVTAVDIAPMLLADQSYLFAVGLENGAILLYKWKVDKEQCSWTMSGSLDNIYNHHLTVTRLRFNPKRKGNFEGKDSFRLASSGADSSVRIYDISL